MEQAAKDHEVAEERRKHEEEEAERVKTYLCFSSFT